MNHLAKINGVLNVLFGAFLSNLGDSFSARITPTGRQVVKISKGNVKQSAVRYPSGTVVETRVYKP